MLGIQRDLLHLVNKTRSDLFYYETIPVYLSIDDRHAREIQNLNYILLDNVNFACKFFISAPLNSFIHAQFTELLLPTTCQASHVKLYSSFSRNNSTNLAQWANLGQSPFLRLCSTTPPLTETETTTSTNENSSTGNLSYVFVFFFYLKYNKAYFYTSFENFQQNQVV